MRTVDQYKAEVRERIKVNGGYYVPPWYIDSKGKLGKTNLVKALREMRDGGEIRWLSTIGGVEERWGLANADH